MINKLHEEKSFGPFSQKSKKKWTNDEDKKLIEIAMISNERNWKNISTFFKDKTDVQCRSRYKRIKPGMRKGRWTHEEDNKLLELFKIYGNNWSKLAKIFNNRTAQQIRNRYINILNPNLNQSKLNKEDDIIIFNLYLKYGSSWKNIQEKAFKHHTPDAIKNRFYSFIKKNTFTGILSINFNKNITESINEIKIQSSI